MSNGMPSYNRADFADRFRKPSACSAGNRQTLNPLFNLRPYRCGESRWLCHCSNCYYSDTPHRPWHAA